MYPGFRRPAGGSMASHQMSRVRPNNSMQRTALCAAADAER